MQKFRTVAAIAAAAVALTLGACSVEEGGKDKASDKNDKGSSKGSGKGSNAEDEAGRYQNPMDIKVGKPFEVDGFNYSAGWRLTNEFGMASIEGLKVTNNRGESDSALVSIKAWKGSEVIGSIDCTSDPIAPDTTVTLNCFSGDSIKGFDRLTIEDTF